MTSPISQLTAMSGNSKVIMSPENHPAAEDVKLIRKTKFLARVLLWLAVSESGISKPVFFKAGLAVNKEEYISKCLPVLHKFIHKQKQTKKSCSYLIWRLHTTQRIRWSD
jgi:hypothetical protein